MSLDACRGFTILLVIYSHIVQLDPSAPSSLNHWLMLFRMPMFLFISGYLAFATDLDVTKIKKRIRKRIVCQLYPTIIFWILFIIITHMYDGWAGFGLLSPLYHKYKNGYWFTFVLVELFFLSVPLLYIFRQRTFHKFVPCLILFTSSALLFLLEPCISYCINNNAYCDLLFNMLTLELLCKYGGFFFLGMMAKELGIFWSFVTKPFCFIISLFGFFLCTGFSNPGLHPAYYTYIGSGCFGILFISSLFSYLTKLSNIIVVKLINVLKWIGSMTLEIYLMHFIVIKVVIEPYLAIGCKNYTNTAMEFPCILGLSITTVLIVSIMVQILKRLDLYKYFFPKVKEAKIYNPVAVLT